jgi:hypothetical protein
MVRYGATTRRRFWRHALPALTQNSHSTEPSFRQELSSSRDQFTGVRVKSVIE